MLMQGGNMAHVKGFLTASSMQKTPDTEIKHTQNYANSSVQLKTVQSVSGVKLKNNNKPLQTIQ